VPGKTGKKVRIAIVTNAVAPFWNPMKVGMERAAQKLGCEAVWQGPANAQVSEQRKILENFVAQKVDGIAISPIEPEPMTPVLDEIAASGILVITMDSDAPKSKRLVYLGTNNYSAGRVAGETARRILGGKRGKAVAFVGKLAAENARERLRGFKESTQGFIDVLEVRQDQTNKEAALRNAEDAIQAFPEANLFLGLWSYNGPAIAQAVTSAGKRDNIKIVCFDAEPNTLKHLQKGEIDATIVQKPYLFGYLSVMVLHNMVTLGVEETLAILPKDRIIDTGVEVVTPKNVAAFMKKLQEMGVESS